MLCRDVLALLSKYLKDSMTVSEAMTSTWSGYVMYASNTMSISTAVLEEYIYMHGAVDELINK